MCCGCGVVWQVRTLTGHSHAVRSAAFSPNGECIVSGSEDYLVKIWDVATGAEVRSFERGRFAQTPKFGEVLFFFASVL